MVGARNNSNAGYAGTATLRIEELLNGFDVCSTFDRNDPGWVAGSTGT